MVGNQKQFPTILSFSLLFKFHNQVEPSLGFTNLPYHPGRGLNSLIAAVNPGHGNLRLYDITVKTSVYTFRHPYLLPFFHQAFPLHLKLLLSHIGTLLSYLRHRPSARSSAASIYSQKFSSPASATNPAFSIILFG